MSCPSVNAPLSDIPDVVYLSCFMRRNYDQKPLLRAHSGFSHCVRYSMYLKIYFSGFQYITNFVTENVLRAHVNRYNAE